jgi:hypothetical protein
MTYVVTSLGAKQARKVGTAEVFRMTYAKLKKTIPAMPVPTIQ